MLFFIISIIVLVLGILFCVVDFEALGITCCVLGVTGALVFGIILFVNQTVGRSMMIDYECDLAKYNLAINNPNITASERSDIIEMISDDNRIILKNKYWRNNFWLKDFYYAPLGDLPLFDLSKIPYAVVDIRADVKVDMR